MWTPLDPALASALTPARLELHWAAQIPAAAAATLLPAQDDFSHTALRWDDGVLQTESIDAGHVALELATFAVRWTRGGEVARLSLAGRTLADALSWLSERAGREIHRLEHDLPDHPVARGDAFGAPEAAHLRELSAWFGDAHDVLRSATADLEGASPVRCWPHHFDIASLVDLGEGKSIGLGLSPGDGGYPSPYFYVTPWPYPETDALPDLTHGARWHTEGWVGAVLVGSDLGAESQREQVLGALEGAAAACRRLLLPT